MLKIFYHPNSLKHDMGPKHLEAPVRIEKINEAILASHLEYELIESTPIDLQYVKRVHSSEHIKRLQETKGKKRTVFTADTIANEHTYEAALTAAGAAIQMLSHLDKHHTFAMVRPPGHHATGEDAMGFCFLNNIAIAAQHLVDKGAEKVVILDVDNHHGNGTEKIFFSNPDVLYISLHADPMRTYPGTGFTTEIGTRGGEGKNINVPLPISIEDESYLYLFDEIVPQIMKQFQPEYILISLGLDALKNDPYGALGLSADGFYEIGRRIGSFATKYDNHKVGVVLEGGYNYDQIGKATVSFFEGINSPKGETRVKPKANKELMEITYKLKAQQRKYWFGI